MERFIQTIKHKLGAAKLSPGFANIQDALRQFIDDIRVTKVYGYGVFFSFDLDFGRKPNTELSFAAERLSPRFNLDNQQLKWDLLTAEQRREHCDSRPRVKVVRKGQSNPSVCPYFDGPSTSVVETPTYKALENVVKSANQCLSLKTTISHDEGLRTLKTVIGRNQILAATLRSNLSVGTLRFSTQMPAEHLQTSSSERYLDSLVLHIPEKVEIFPKILEKKSELELFKPFKGKSIRKTYIIDKHKVIRRTHVAVHLETYIQVFQASRSPRPRRGGNAQQRQPGLVAPPLRLLMTTGLYEHPVPASA